MDRRTFILKTLEKVEQFDINSPNAPIIKIAGVQMTYLSDLVEQCTPKDEVSEICTNFNGDVSVITTSSPNFNTERYNIGFVELFPQDLY